MYTLTKSTGLPFDIIVLIAERDPIVWAKIALADPDFCKWAATECNIARFLKLFLKTIHSTRSENDWIYPVIEYRLFTDTPLHSCFDHVACIDEIDREMIWYYHGSVCRDDDHPTMVAANGTRKWSHHDKANRDNDLSDAIIAYDELQWHCNGKIHREDGMPAIINYKEQCWCRYGLPHRDEDQPAIIQVNGNRHYG
jgi:hypothetical protein